MQTMMSNVMKVGRISPQYMIYAYQKYTENSFGYNEWRYLGGVTDAKQALEEAQKAFETEQFQKIEVKEKKFDLKKKRYFVSTFRIFESKAKANNWIKLSAIILLVAVFCFVLLEIYRG